MSKSPVAMRGMPSQPFFASPLLLPRVMQRIMAMGRSAHRAGMMRGLGFRANQLANNGDRLGGT